MTRTDSLLAELTHETTTARKHLARLRTEQFDWRPHVKSFTAGQLAAHIVDCIRWVEPTFSADELDFDPSTYTPCRVGSAEALLDELDPEVTKARQAMVNLADPNATQPWKLTVRGKVWFEKPREDVFRDMTLSHLVHHRGQFSVYLRLLEVPVPVSYGPTADEGL